MVEVAARPNAASTPHVTPETYTNAYRWMVLARLAEEKLAHLYRAGKIFGGVFIGRGQEALSVALGVALRKGDVFAPLIRDQAGRLAFGESLLSAVQTYLGSKLGPMRGRDGNVHRGKPREGHMAMISHLGAMISVVAGALMAKRFAGVTDMVGATCLGDGGTSTGSFHEGINLAAVERLPLVMVVANNQYAYSTPNWRQFVCADLVDKAVGYGIEGYTVDATNLAACLDVLGHAVSRARSGHGPQLVVGSLLRLGGHGEHDDGSYIDPKLKEHRLGRDCLKLAEEYLLAHNWATPAEIVSWHDDAQRQVDEAVATAQREPAPDPNDENWEALATSHLVDGFAS